MMKLMRSIKTACLVLVLAVALGAGSAQPVSAACSNGSDILGCACEANQGPNGTPAVCTADPTKDPLTGPNGMIKKVTLLLSVIAGIVAVVLIIIGGIRYVVANGDPQKAANARQMIIGSVVGLAIIGVSSTIVVFVVSRL